MVFNGVNILINEKSWIGQTAVSSIFKSRQVELLLAEKPLDALDIIQKRPVHTAILDIDNETLGAMSVMKVIRAKTPTLPCILLSGKNEKELLASALKLDVFSVIAKPVDLAVLQGQLHRLFTKKYNSSLFAVNSEQFTG